MHSMIQKMRVTDVGDFPVRLLIDLASARNPCTCST